MSVQKIDRDKLRAAIRNLGNESVYFMLAEAIDMLPPAKLEKLARRPLNLAQLQPDAKSKGSLLEEVKAFEKASLHGDYYESFDVNWKNSTEMSRSSHCVEPCGNMLAFSGRCRYFATGWSESWGAAPGGAVRRRILNYRNDDNT
jgi:hypothetical protein